MRADEQGVQQFFQRFIKGVTEEFLSSGGESHGEREGRGGERAHKKVHSVYRSLLSGPCAILRTRRKEIIAHFVTVQAVATRPLSL